LETVKRPKRGWLVVKERRERRDRPYTLTDADVLSLLEKIDSSTDYAHLDFGSSPQAEELKAYYEALMKHRDKALIALAWLFFKRGSEVLGVRLGDVFIDEEDKKVEVTFTVKKKAKTFKVCPKCGEKNARKARYCKACGSSIVDVPVRRKASKTPTIVVKRKTLENPFARTFVRWIRVLKRFQLSPEAYVFPPFDVAKKTFNFERHLTVARFDQILQRLDYTLTSHMFRYGAAEKYLRLKYTPHEVAQFGDWASSVMVEKYAKRKGITPEQERFAEELGWYERK